MSELAKLEPGQWVCVVGRGTDVMAHRHNVVVRVTKTMLVTRRPSTSKWETKSFQRFRLDNGRSVPYSPYGGSEAHIGCQRPKDRVKTR